MTTLYDSRSAVKSARVFGKGILRALPSQRLDYTASDAAWHSGFSLTMQEIEAAAPGTYSPWEALCFEAGAEAARAEIDAKFQAMADELGVIDDDSIFDVSPAAKDAARYEESELARMFGRDLARVLEN